MGRRTGQSPGYFFAPARLSPAGMHIRTLPTKDRKPRTFHARDTGQRLQATLYSHKNEKNFSWES